MILYPIKNLPQRNPRKTDWINYESVIRENLNSEIKKMTSIDDIDEACTAIQNAVIKAYESTCKLSNPPVEGNP